MARALSAADGQLGRVNAMKNSWSRIDRQAQGSKSKETKVGKRNGKRCR